MEFPYVTSHSIIRILSCFIPRTCFHNRITLVESVALHYQNSKTEILLVHFSYIIRDLLHYPNYITRIPLHYISRIPLFHKRTPLPHQNFIMLPEFWFQNIVMLHL